MPNNPTNFKRTAYPAPDNVHPEYFGVSKLEYFTAHAMQGILAASFAHKVYMDERTYVDVLSRVAKESVDHARATLQNLESQNVT